ncbi:M23 family metallopeptidase [Streptomyces sp. GS7]|uniref:M23 family metallopeptidase n=1 Tax=Streptomyces sp. GS7 TaxID=2692234 RepID=UPI00131904A7|nr:M23 family metallopeptidase [Streptomyces sp. GS7]QHC20301.1 peptidoglycan DD-metalloendopeptidase family protein [Streptomyces sp. GS7]
MASNRPAPHAPSAYDLAGPGRRDGVLGFDVPAADLPDPGEGRDTCESPADTTGFAGAPGFAAAHDGASVEDDGPWEEWNPTEESVRPVRGKHRVAKQRSGGLARGGTVLGVGVIAAVGAGGMATAEDRPPVPISMPDLGGMADDLAGKLPDAASLPGIGSLLSDGGGTATASAAGTDAPSAAGADSTPASAGTSRPLSQAGVTHHEAGQGTGAAEALRSRILQQADAQQGAADREARETAEHSAIQEAAKDATVHQKTAEQAAAAEKEAAAEAKRQAAEAARLAELAKSYVVPVSSYTLTASFGQAGDHWAANHTGQDFAAPTGSLVKAVHSGTITKAGWAGPYGYRIVLTLDDGTELWFCHLSSMVKTSGKVTTGDVIARVGATGNVTGPHLHLEVRPDAGDPIDPMPWLRDHGVGV